MNIGILGSGTVGQTLAKGFLNLGHTVTVGTRNEAKLFEWKKRMNNDRLHTGSFAGAAAFGEVLVLATHGLAAVSAIDLAGAEHFNGKVVVDVTNPLDSSQGPPPKFAATLGNSLGEQIQRRIPAARVVKAFNIVNCNIMINARLQEGAADMFMAGNDPAAKEWVAELARAWGWNACHDLGTIQESYWLEALAMIWIKFGSARNHWTHAFKLLMK
jgi:hypothetical protein